MLNIGSTPNLYLVVIGGRYKHCHIEQHDVRWVAGQRIEDTYPQLRKEWNGIPSSLHIDSFVQIKYIDGYQIILCNDQLNADTFKDQYSQPIFVNHNYLWFVNIGGYNSYSLYELHECQLVVTESISKAKQRALAKSDIKHMKHRDDIYRLNSSISLDDLSSINKVQEWHIKLIKDPLDRSQFLKPDWYGYLPIHNDKQLDLFSIDTLPR